MVNTWLIWRTWLTGAILGVLWAFLIVSHVAAQGEATTTIPTVPQAIPEAILSWEFLVAVVISPLVVAFVAKPETSSRAKTIAMCALSIGSVVVGMFLRGELAGTSLNNWIAIILFACVMAAGFYKGIQKPLGISPGTVGRGA